MKLFFYFEKQKVKFSSNLSCAVICMVNLAQQSMHLLWITVQNASYLNLSGNFRLSHILLGNPQF